MLEKGKQMDFNINETVLVKLTDHGRSVRAREHARWTAEAGVKLEYHPPKEDAEGWSSWQLWSLMREFGPHIYMGGPLCFETAIRIVPPQPYEPPSQDPMDAVRSMCG